MRGISQPSVCYCLFVILKLSLRNLPVQTKNRRHKSDGGLKCLHFSTRKTKENKG